jgi:hypothetical protein
MLAAAVTVNIMLNGKLEWRASQSASSKRWIGVCDPLNLAMEAESLDELHSVIHEATNALMHDLLSDNELAAFLKERGWTADNIPAGDSKYVDFSVPWELIAEGSHGPERRAN